jgi:hypothetical protein
VLGGLLVSTVVTLVLVPTAFSLTMQAKRFVLERFGLRGDDPFDDGESDGSSIDEPLIASPVAEFKKATG